MSLAPRTFGVSLDALFALADRTGAPGIRVSACTADWRDVQAGDAFVAVLSDDDDGHDHAAEAVRRGAAVVICDRPVAAFGVPVYQVEDSRIAYGELCHALVEHPSRRIKTIGIVGTHGKTAAATLLESIFRAADFEFGVLSSTKTSDGISVGPGWGEAPSPVEFASRLARMEAAGCTHAIVETSSVALAQARLAGVEFDAVCVTSISERRLDLHHTRENYRNAERRALDLLSPTGMAVLNADDQVCCRWLAELDAPALTYGLGDAAQIMATIVEENATETLWVLAAGDDSAAIRSTVVGRKHVENCLAAATVALVEGIDLETIARGIEQVGVMPGQMERIDCGQEFPVYVDSAAAPHSLAAALRTARQFAAGRVICVLGDSLPNSVDETASLRSVIRKLADVAIVTDRAAGNLNPDDQWLSTDRLQVVADRGEAIAWAVAMADAGDVVVVAGSFARPRFAFGERTETIGDVEAVREMLYARNTPALRLAA
ncbi:MAG: hypothetical protein KF847_04005 [Pirellulales bacterium]|nr:hypothetical protein [Pirellulales bacterium]